MCGIHCHCSDNLAMGSDLDLSHQCMELPLVSDWLRFGQSELAGRLLSDGWEEIVPAPGGMMCRYEAWNCHRHFCYHERSQPEDKVEIWSRTEVGERHRNSLTQTHLKNLLSWTLVTGGNKCLWFKVVWVGISVLVIEESLIDIWMDKQWWRDMNGNGKSLEVCSIALPESLLFFCSTRPGGLGDVKEMLWSCFFWRVGWLGLSSWFLALLRIWGEIYLFIESGLLIPLPPRTLTLLGGCSEWKALVPPVLVVCEHIHVGSCECLLDHRHLHARLPHRAFSLPLGRLVPRGSFLEFCKMHKKMWTYKGNQFCSSIFSKIFKYSDTVPYMLLFNVIMVSHGRSNNYYNSKYWWSMEDILRYL